MRVLVEESDMVWEVARCISMACVSGVCQLKSYSSINSEHVMYDFIINELKYILPSLSLSHTFSIYLLHQIISIFIP